MPVDAEKRRERYAEDPEYRKKNSQRAERSRKKKSRQDQRLPAHEMGHRPRVPCQGQRQEAKPGYRLKERCRKHGISVEEYQRILTRQHNACGICEQPFLCTPCIDHCHKTRMVRGLLCNKCNLGLGNYNDNPAFLRKPPAISNAGSSDFQNFTTERRTT
jgi:Recombination endonuclease VII